MSSEIQKYRPSNGTEGDIFQAGWCEKCSRDNFNEDTGRGGCPILAKTMRFNPQDEEYPIEWRFENDKPICTEFQDGSPPLTDADRKYLAMLKEREKANE